MESLQNSCSSSNELEHQTSLDRLGNDIKNLNLVSSPATVTSLVETPDLEQAKYSNYGQILSCDDPNQPPYSQADPALTCQTRKGEVTKEPVSADELVPSIYMHPSVSDDDEVICVIRILQNSRYCSYRTTTNADLSYYIPPNTLEGRQPKPFFGMLGRPTIDPRTNTDATIPVNASGTVLTGRALLWACARSADLIPSDPTDVMTAFGIWSKVMYLLNRVRIAKNKPDQSSRNHHLRYFIMDLKAIERELNQICAPGQVRPCVLGSGKYSFADYAVARAYELLLDDTSFFRLPYTRQKKYARIIEIALNIHISRSNNTGAMIQDFRPAYQRPAPNINTWEELVWTKLNRSLFNDSEQIGGPENHHQHQTGGLFYSASPAAYLEEHSDDDISEFDARSVDSDIWVKEPLSERCPFTADFGLNDLSHIPRTAESEFIYFCHPEAPLRHFLHKFGLVVAKRKATWHDPSEELWTDQVPYHKLGVAFEKSKYNFAVIYSKPNKRDRCCWSLQEMFAHKSLYHQDSIAEQAAIEILENYLEPVSGVAIPAATLTKLEASLQFEAQSRLVLPAIAIEQMKNFGQEISPSLYPRIHQGIHDPIIVKFLASIA